MNKAVQNSNSNKRSIIDCKRDKIQGSEEAYLHVTPIFEELNSLFLKSSHEYPSTFSMGSSIEFSVVTSSKNSQQRNKAICILCLPFGYDGT